MPNVGSSTALLRTRPTGAVVVSTTNFRNGFLHFNTASITGRKLTSSKSGRHHLRQPTLVPAVMISPSGQQATLPENGPATEEALTCSSNTMDWVVCDRMPIANATIEGFAIFRANDFEAHRNGFHAEVVSASCRLGKGGQVPIVRIAGMSVTQSIECQQSSHVLVRCYRPGRQTAQTYRDGVFKIAHLQANCLFRVNPVGLAVRRAIRLRPQTADMRTDIGFRR